MLALLAALLGYALWRPLSHIHPEALLAHASSLAPIALGATAIASALATQRRIATRRALRTRRAVAVVPADEFDPRPEQIASFAAQLGRSDRRIGGWFDRPASALRIHLTNDSEGRLVYLLEAPEREAARLRAALRGYRGVELRDASEVLGAEGGEEAAQAVRAEMVLSQPSVEPLARLPLDPDPLAPFAAALTGVERGRGETVSVCVDLLPASGRRARRLRRRLRRQARRRGREPGVGLAEVLAGERESRSRDPVELFERRALGQGLEAKLREGATLFEAQVLVCARAPHRGRAKSLMTSLLAAFEPLADRNWLRASGIEIAGLAFLGSDLPWRRGRFDRRLASGLFRPARRNVLTTAELAGFLKPPNSRCVVDNVLRSGALLAPAPAGLPDFEPERDDLIPLGTVTSEQGDRLLGVKAAETHFTYIAGRSRYGKTELAVAMFTHLVRSGHGGLFIDPHGDALARIRPYLGESGVGERVVEIDLGPGGGSEQPAWNLFELRGAGGAEAEARVEAIVDAFAAAMGWGEASTRAINLTTQAAAALAAISRVLPEGLAPTIFQLPTLLGDERWREAALPFLPSAAKGFWHERFPRLSSEAITPVTNLVDRLRSSSATTALLGQSQSTFSLREAMDEGLIVLLCPGLGGTRERLVANLAAFDVLHAARSRAELAPESRKRFAAVFDEVQSYDSDSLAALLEQGAKFGLRAIYLNQNPERLRPATLAALTTNRSHLLASTLNSRAAALITKEWGNEPSPAALTNLQRYRFVAQVTDGGELSRPFALAGVQVEDALGPASPGSSEKLEKGIAASGRRRSVAAALAHLETLDERILAALQERAGAAGGDEEDEAMRIEGER
ncbi:MAG: hypothetical protein AB7F97_03750 [Solirubrobacterales bacterium]